MGVDPDERLIADVDRELFSEEAEFESMVLSLAEKCKEGEILREKIAMDMWKDYNRNLYEFFYFMVLFLYSFLCFILSTMIVFRTITPLIKITL